MPEVIIVGAGLAGINCALYLQGRGLDVQLVEAADRVGGRVRTDLVEGFQLDRGFQVLQTSYREAQKTLDYSALQLHHFDAGAVVRVDGRFHRLADPRRVPSRIFSTLLAPVGTLRDKLRVLELVSRLVTERTENLLKAPERTTLQALHDSSFSPLIIERFFRPFLSGIFLEEELETSSRKFEFVMRMFALGRAALPAHGMEEIPKQIAAKLPANSIMVNARVRRLTGNTVELENGTVMRARAVVIATDFSSAAVLLGLPDPRPWNGTACLYFAAEKPPMEEPVLVLNGEGSGSPINNLCVLSNVAPEYAPPGASLISVTLHANATRNVLLDTDLRMQLRQWFGSQTRSWRELGRYVIPRALPSQKVSDGGLQVHPPRVRPGVYAAGDYMDSGSINGALRSGRKAAEAILEDLKAS